MEDNKEVSNVDAKTVLNNLLFYTEDRIEEIEKCHESLDKVGAVLSASEESKLHGRDLELRELKQVVEASINGLDY